MTSRSRKAMKGKTFGQAMTPNHVQAVQERRRSNAAGTHVKRRNRSADNRRAIADNRE